MKFTHISAFTIAALATSVHAILPQSSETIDSVDPSPSPSLNSESFPQATGGPEFPSTSTATQGPGDNQGDHSNQTPESSQGPSNTGGFFNGFFDDVKNFFGFGHDPSSQDGSIDLLLESLPKVSGAIHPEDPYTSMNHFDEKTNHHQKLMVETSISTSFGGGSEGDFKKDLMSYLGGIGMYEKWVKDILDSVTVFQVTGRSISKFINELVWILEKLLKMMEWFQKEIYEIMIGLNKDSSQSANAIKLILDLMGKFMSTHMNTQQLLEKLFERHSRIDWYHEHLEAELGSWSERFGKMQKYSA
ncbi:hypothetical protein BDV3_000147 [Batrachochytrium dendrobatidis]